MYRCVCPRCAVRFVLPLKRSICQAMAIERRGARREERRGQGLYVLYMEALTPSDAAHFRECSWLVQWELTLAALV